jgi:hypothetical protein
MNRNPERDRLSVAALCRPIGLSAFPDGVAAGTERGARAHALAAALLILTCSLPAHAWGGKVKLARKHRPGQRMVYQTRLQTQATVRAHPPGLEAFLPTVPTEISTQQQNTVTVRAVHPDGIAEVEIRFDAFEFQSNLPDLLPEDVRDSARAAQEEFTKQLRGQVLTARYDRAGRLLDFAGADDLLEELDPPLQQTARQALQTFLEQMGGPALYPDHRVKKGEEWKRKVNAAPTEAYPFSVEGENTMRFGGTTKYRGVKAARIDFRFTNLLRPSLNGPRPAGPPAQPEAQGLGLDLQIDGQGQGQALVALDDGRILQNHATFHQTLRARLKAPAGNPLPTADPLTMEVVSETRLEVDSAGEQSR